MNKAAALTRGFNTHRTGCNLQETVLTPAVLQARGLQHLFDCHLDGDARGTEGAPLIVPGLTMRDGLPHDVLFAASQGNDVFAWDANTGLLLWKQRIGNPVNNNKTMDMFMINDHWGVLSTPVIDPLTRTLYLVAMTSPTGLLADSVFYLHALDLRDGSEQAAPLDLNLAATHPTVTGKGFVLGSVPRKQRPALLFDSRNGVSTVFVGYGSFNEAADTNQGWLVACDVSPNRLTLAACWTATTLTPGAGIWMSGGGPAMDDNGDVFLMTGNGGFDGVNDFGESFCKLRYTPATATATATLTVVDWFTPFTDAGRVGGDPTLASVTLIQGADATPGGPSNMDDPHDQDLNSGSPVYIGKSATGYGKNVVVGAGKDGIIYVLDADRMGRTQLASFAPSRILKEVYGALLSPAIGFTYDPRPMDTMPVNLALLSTTLNGFTHHQHGPIIFFNSNDHGPILLTGGENGPVRGWTLNSDYSLSYLGCGAEIASYGVPAPGGMPGSLLSVSANGRDNGILWCLQPLSGGDANKAVVPGRLIAYAANWFRGTAMVKLWDSSQWGPDCQFLFNKFNVPVCVNGKVYVPTYDGRIAVFG